MTSRLISALAMAVLLAGCGKSSRTPSPPPTQSTASSSNPETAGAAESAVVSGTERAAAVAPSPDPATAVRVAVASEADPTAALEALTQTLRKYSFEHQRLPKTFDEVVAAGYVKDMPRAPVGKKFAIDPKTVRVVLVKK